MPGFHFRTRPFPWQRRLGNRQLAKYREIWPADYIEQVEARDEETYMRLKTKVAALMR